MRPAPRPLARRLVACTVVVVAALVAALPPVAAVPRAAVRSGVAPEALRWRGCGAGFECASLAVPLVHDAPDGRTVELALVRAPATDPGRRIGSLVVNPGGPGGSAVEFVRVAASSLPSELRARFDVVGVDPRGSGSSDPVDCRYDMAPYYALDFSPDDEGERTALLDGVRTFVDACVAAEGDRLPYLGTRETVRDLELVRRALGDDGLTFLGYSYGSYVGARYAEAYPDRVRALVLDGAVDPSVDARTLSVEQSAGFEGVLDAFLRWCAADRACAFHRDGRPDRALDALLRRVDREGLPVPGERPERVLSPAEFDLGLATSLYEGAAGFPFLGDALDAAARGDGSLVAALSDTYTERSGDGSYGGIEQAFLAISCADGPPIGTVEDARAVEDAAARVAPRLGRAIVNNSLACALWPHPGPPAAEVRAPGAPPLLVVGTRRDPATPFAWAEGLARQLESGVLLSAPGTQHTSFGLGNACVDATVVRYLVDLDVPDGTVVCRRR